MQPDPNYFWQFIACVALIGSIGANISMVMRGRRRDVAIIPGAVTTEQCQRQHDLHEVNGHAAQFAALRSEFNERGEQRAEKIHRRINSVLRGVARIEGKLGIQPSAEEEIES